MRHGILYPDILRYGSPVGAVDHNPVAESLVGFIRYPSLSAEEYFDQFAEQCERHQCRTLLLSGESFFSMPQVWRLEEGSDYLAHYRAKLERLKAHLGEAFCTVVVYLRRQEEWLESAIGHMIRYEGLYGQRVYVNDEKTLELLAPHMDYATLVDLWDDILKPVTLIAVPYERDRLQDRDVVRDFVRRVGLPLGPDGTETVDDENISLDRRYIWLKNILNRIDRSKDEERVIIDRLTVLNNQLPVRLKWRMTEELKASCRDRFASSNERLARRFGVAPDPFFTSPRPGPGGPSPIARPDAMREVDDRLAALLSFDQLYFSPATAWIRARTRLASKLRYGYPRLHTAAKRLARPFL